MRTNNHAANGSPFVTFYARLFTQQRLGALPQATPKRRPHLKSGDFNYTVYVGIPLLAFAAMLPLKLFVAAYWSGWPRWLAAWFVESGG